MKQVTIANVRERIAELEMVNSHVELSLRGEFELACLRQLAALMEQKPYGYAELYDFPRTTATLYPEQDRYATMPLYAAPPAPVSVPNDEQCKPHPVMAVKGELGFLDHFDRIISERDEDIDIGQLGCSNYEALMLAALDAFRAAMHKGAEPSPAADNTAQQFEALATSAGSGKL